MTIHRAKGLEFPVVCVCDLGKDGRDDEGSLRISEDGSVGLRLAGSAGRGGQRAARAHQGRGQARRGGRGAADLLRGGDARPGAPHPERRHRPREAPRAGRAERADALGLARLLRRPAGARARRASTTTPSRGAPSACAWQRLTPATLDELLPEADRAPVAAAARARARPRAAGARARRAARAAGPPGQPPELLGARGLPALRLPLLPGAGARARRPSSRRCRPSCSRAEAGLDRPAARLDRPWPARAARLPAAAWCPRTPRSRARSSATARRRAPEDVADLRAMVERVAARACASGSRPRRRVRTELPFAFTLAPPGAGGRSLLVNGVVDVHAIEDGGTLVVDWKSDALDGRDPEALVAERYSTQRLVYALAALRAGAERVEVAHCFLERPDEPAVAAYDDAPTPRGSRGSCSSSPAGSSRPASAADRAPRGPLRRLPRPGRALHPRARAHAARRAGCSGTVPRAPFPSGPRPICDPYSHAIRRGAKADAALLHRATGSDQGRRRERRARGAPAAARRGRARLGRRDPRRRAAGALRQGRRRARRRRSVDARRMARRRSRSATRSPTRSSSWARSRASASTAARRCGSRPASRATTPSRRASARSRRSTPFCPGCRTSA